MDTVKIILTCPGCGHDVWTREDENKLRCLSCGDEVDPKYMVPIIEPVECGF